MPKGIFKISPITEMVWDFPYDTLNQGETGHCVGMSMASFGIASPINDVYNNDTGHSFYYMCKEKDGEPESEEGSNLRSAAKVLKDVGRIDAYAFAYTQDEIKWWILNRGPVILGTGWCVAPGTKILTEDLKWIPVEEVSSSLSVIGFDENPDRNCSYRKSTVLSNNKITQPCWEITTNRGKIIVSENHMFIQRFKKTARKWTQACDLKPGDELLYLGDPWEEDNSREAGWLAGFYDGEGTISVSKNGKRHGNVLSCVQKPGKVFDYAISILEEKGFKYTLHPRPQKIFDDGRVWSEVIRWNIKGENARMRFLGSIRPKRLLENAYSVWEGKNISGSSKHATVQRCRFIGNQDVYAVSTSTKTLITDGYLSHNCEGMYTPDADNMIRPTGEVVGGHAYLGLGLTPKGYAIKNSWGSQWGDNGVAYISLDDFQNIFRYGGEAMTAVELPLVKNFKKKKPCLFQFLK